MDFYKNVEISTAAHLHESSSQESSVTRILSVVTWHSSTLSHFYQHHRTGIEYRMDVGPPRESHVPTTSPRKNNNSVTKP